MSEKATSLRVNLKSAGFNGRKVTVRHNHFSMGSEIIVTVWDPAVSIKAVKDIASSYEKIDRCEITGEILGGGNTYLDVRYSDQALKSLTDAILPAVQDAISQLPDGESNSLIPIGDTGYLVGHDRCGGYSVWGNGTFIMRAYNADAVAQIVAVHGR